MTSTAEHSTSESHRGIRIRTLSIVAAVIAIVLSIGCLVTIRNTFNAYNKYASITERYFACETAANEMQAGSDYLTTQVRLFVITQQPRYLEHYYQEVNVTRRRDTSVQTLTDLIGESSAQTYLDQALIYSDELMEIEQYAMRLVVDAIGIDVTTMAPQLANIVLSEHDTALSPEEKLELAREMVHDSTYQHYDDLIEENVNLCKDELISRVGQERGDISALLGGFLGNLRLLIIILVLSILAVLVIFSFQVTQPIRRYVAGIQRNVPLEGSGAYELQYLSHAYNVMFEENRRSNERLRRKSELDGLTGIYNRDVFENVLEETQDQPMGLILIDVDNFKGVNDTHGHVVGDKVLQKVSAQLSQAFRSSDYACRIGGDEFAILMVDATPRLAPIITEKISAIREALLDDSDGTPAVTLSIGIAFGPLAESSDEGAVDDKSLYKRADEALYRVKDAGRNGYQFWR